MSTTVKDKGYTVDHVIRVWNDRHGDRYEVSEDGDALGLVQIQYIADDGAKGSYLSFPRDQAELIAYAILEYLKNAPTT